MERNSVTCARVTRVHTFRSLAWSFFQCSRTSSRPPHPRLCRPGWAPLRPLHALALSTPTPNPSSLARWCAALAPFWLAAAYPKAIDALCATHTTPAPSSSSSRFHHRLRTHTHHLQLHCHACRLRTHRASHRASTGDPRALPANGPPPSLVSITPSSPHCRS